MAFKVALKKFNPLSSNGVSPPPSSGYIFPSTTPEVDGEDCLHDCETCTTHYPRKFAIDETDKLYGEINGWSRHLIVATGKSDWVREVSDEKGSVMEAVGVWQSEVERAGKKSDTKLMLSASNIPLPDQTNTAKDISTDDSVAEQQEHGTTCLLLPAFMTLSHVTPDSISRLLTSEYFKSTPTNTSELASDNIPQPFLDALPAGIDAKACPHDYLILLCSQKTRDARCGQSAPLLKREFERHLRPLGLYRDLDDDREGGVGIYFISHVGGHKYSANCLVYRSTRAVEQESQLSGGDGQAAINGHESAPQPQKMEGGKEAAQCIWLARVRPEDCENILRYTVLQGKVVKPARQLRGGFDRYTGKVSW